MRAYVITRAKRAYIYRRLWLNRLLSASVVLLVAYGAYYVGRRVQEDLVEVGTDPTGATITASVLALVWAVLGLVLLLRMRQAWRCWRNEHVFTGPWSQHCSACRRFVP